MARVGFSDHDLLVSGIRLGERRCAGIANLRIDLSSSNSEAYGRALVLKICWTVGARHAMA